MRKRLRFPIIILFTAIAVFSCSNPQLTSQWADQPYTIDGDTRDWDGNLQYFTDEGFGIGIANDQDNLYFCAVITDDELRRQVVMRGLNIWLDSGGGESEEYGLRYPLGMAAMPPQLRRKLQQSANSRTNMADPSTPSFDQIPDQLLMEFALMGKKALGDDFSGDRKEKILFREPVFKNRRGIQLQINTDSGQFIYEGKIPLAEFSQFAGQTNKIVGIGIELPEIQRSRRGDPQTGFRGGASGTGGMASPGDAGAGQGGIGGNSEGMRQGAEQRTHSMEFWAELVLARVN
ncbi:MAG: hypothetical protein K9N46_12670 [Candidatus Marinimicrobia bacterium]|nr:hypothetical protein [Candidatus Neomarinimicrobiota bacterium]MCF7827554.1 hypothetical protein [Candidatus Neomarinimicrobiota bacterium]MCF7881584.1 hypothetical protein [Candidatus Neomarinimicrobiota bacterium]